MTKTLEELLKEGKTSKEILDELSLETNETRTELQKAMEKLEVNIKKLNEEINVKQENIEDKEQDEK